MANRRGLSSVSGILRGLVEGQKQRSSNRLIETEQRQADQRLSLQEKDLALRDRNTRKTSELSEGRLRLQNRSFDESVRQFQVKEKEKQMLQQRNAELVENLRTVQQLRDFAEIRKDLNNPEVSGTPEFLTKLESFRKKMALEGLNVRRLAINPQNLDEGDLLLLENQDGLSISDEELMRQGQTARNAALADIFQRSGDPQIFDLVQQVFGQNKKDANRTRFDIKQLGPGEVIIVDKTTGKERIVKSEKGQRSKVEVLKDEGLVVEVQFDKDGRAADIKTRSIEDSSSIGSGQGKKSNKRLTANERARQLLGK